MHIEIKGNVGASEEESVRAFYENIPRGEYEVEDMGEWFMYDSPPNLWRKIKVTMPDGRLLYCPMVEGDHFDIVS